MPSLWDSRPGKERQDGAGMTLLIPIIQVVGSWVVKVYRQFHQSKTQHARVEIDIALRVAGNCCYMMNAENILTHSLSPFPPSCTEHAYEDVVLNHLKNFPFYYNKYRGV